MTTAKTHISLSGKRVPCNAEERACPRGGHEAAPVNDKVMTRIYAFNEAADRFQAAASISNPALLAEKPALDFVSDNDLAARREARMTRDSNVLTELSNSADTLTLINVAKNQWSSDAVLEKLALHPEPAVRKAILSNVFVPLYISRVLKDDTWQYHASDSDTTSASDTKTDPEPAEKEFRAAARRANAKSLIPPKAAPKTTLKGGPKGVREPAPKFASQTALDRREEAKTTRDLDRLEKLSKHKDTITVISVATNRWCDDELLTKLSTHSNDGVRRAVYRNYSTPASVKAKLSQDSSRIVTM
jgi:hypothetical protein